MSESRLFLLEESDYCNTELTIMTKIIPFLTWSSNCIMSHCILHMLSKTGFRYANYLKKKCDFKGGRKKERCSHRVGRPARHFVKLSVFRESLMASKRREGGRKVLQSMLFSKMNRWQSLSVEICFISPSHVGAQWMWASVLFFSSSSNVILQDNGHMQCLS